MEYSEALRYSTALDQFVAITWLSVASDIGTKDLMLYGETWVRNERGKLQKAHVLESALGSEKTLVENASGTLDFLMTVNRAQLRRLETLLLVVEEDEPGPVEWWIPIGDRNPGRDLMEKWRRSLLRWMGQHDPANHTEQAQIKILDNRSEGFKEERSASPTDDRSVHHELAAAHGAIKKLKNRIATRFITREQLLTLADHCRKKNGTINYTKLGKELGVTYHTAQEWCFKERVR